MTLFPLQLIDQITFLLSRQMCHVDSVSLVSVLFRSHIAIPNQKTDSECPGSGLASFMMILVESNISLLGLARMNVCIVAK